MRRVVITGTGIYSCLGINKDEVTDSLYKGKSGIVFDPERKEIGFRSALTGAVPTPDLKKDLDRRQRKSMAQQCDYAFVSTKEALGEAGIDLDFLAKHEAGIIFGNDSSSKAVIESVDTVRAKGDTTLLGSGSIFQSMNCTVTMNLSTIFKLRGINMTLSAACASGSHSVGMGYILIANGYQDLVICGGAQEINPNSMASFDGIGAFSVQESDPTKASRPFDKDRDGLVPGGGAATLILESLESAQARGAKIIAEVVGYGFSSNGEHISNPNLDGQVRSLEMALKRADLTPKDIDYINAHATATPVGDSFEAQAIHKVFGSETPVSSTKSMTGHECWMAGASELVYSMLMMKNGFVAPNINFENPDEYSEKINIFAATEERKIKTILSNSFGFGGTNSSVIITTYE
ncbi:MAG: beta-ketoacyl-[acyl-carrier-protein] synthase family protein [Flavobacteriales bacterium]|nr:beta-ketoacyl-[acyl-carrier-protein] synthase family protein [Flavobacteriales bacterium]